MKGINIENNKIKKEIPQIKKETGISMDYINEIADLISLYNFGGINSVKLRLKNYTFHMKKYEEVYADYSCIVNDQNRERIIKLDILSEELNSNLKNLDSIDVDSFCKIVNEICFLIYGDNNKDISIAGQ